MNKDRICLVCKEDCLLTDTCPAEIFERSKKFMTKKEIKEEERKILRKIKLQELSLNARDFYGSALLKRLSSVLQYLRILPRKDC